MDESGAQPSTSISQAAADLAAEEIIELPPELSPFRRAFRRFLAHKLALAGFICLTIMALLAATQAIVSPFDPEKPHLFKVNRPPDTVNWMGTDQVGRDVFSRILQGARVSLSVGIVAVSIYVVIGFIIGSIAGLVTYKTGTIYAASKHAVHGFSESLRQDFAGTGVRVSEILPGMVRTEFALNRWEDEETAAAFYDDFGTCLLPDDIARAVLYCLRQPPHVVISQLVVMPNQDTS